MRSALAVVGISMVTALGLSHADDKPAPIRKDAILGKWEGTGKDGVKCVVEFKDKLVHVSAQQGGNSQQFEADWAIDEKRNLVMILLFKEGGSLGTARLVGGGKLEIKIPRSQPFSPIPIGLTAEKVKADGKKEGGLPATQEDKRKADAVKEELSRLEGDWTLQRQVKGHQTFTIEGDVLRIKGDQWTRVLLGIGTPGKFQIDPTSSPKAVDLFVEVEKGKAETYRGIYELEDTILKVSFGEKDKGRPERFDSSLHTIQYFKRVKK